MSRGMSRFRWLGWSIERVVEFDIEVMGGRVGGEDVYIRMHSFEHIHV